MDGCCNLTDIADIRLMSSRLDRIQRGVYRSAVQIGSRTLLEIWRKFPLQQAKKYSLQDVFGFFGVSCDAERCAIDKGRVFPIEAFKLFRERLILMQHRHRHP